MCNCTFETLPFNALALSGCFGRVYYFFCNNCSKLFHLIFSDRLVYKLHFISVYQNHCSSYKFEVSPWIEFQ
jgi:hypothetical protein